MHQLGGIEQQLRSVSERIDQTMIVDRYRLRGRLRHLAHASNTPQFVGRFQQLVEEVERSALRYRRRLDHLPKPAFPAELPVVQRREEIGRAIAENQVIVLSGETGSGKT